MLYTSHSKCVRKKIFYSLCMWKNRELTAGIYTVYACACVYVCVVFVCIKPVLFPLSELDIVFIEIPTGKCLS